MLKPQQCPPRIIQAKPHNMGGESFLHLSGGFSAANRARGLLGSGSLEIFSRCEAQFCPGRLHQTCRCHRVFALTNCLEARSGTLLQMPDHQLGNEGGACPSPYANSLPQLAKMGSLHPLRTREPQTACRQGQRRDDLGFIRS